MKITLGQLKSIIREVLRESGGGWASAPQPVARNAMSPDINNRQAIGRLEFGTPIDDDLPEHLRDPQEDPEDCFGPVPPTNGEPYVGQDPFVRDYSPLPTPPIRR
jgi:hypothetical protein